MMRFPELMREWRRKLAGVVLGAPIPSSDTVWEATEGRMLKELTLADMSVGKKVLVELGATRTEVGYIPYITGEVCTAGPLPEGFFLSLYDIPDGRIPIRRPVGFIPELFDEPFEYEPNKIVFYNQHRNRFVLPKKAFVMAEGAVAVSPDSDVGDDFYAESHLYVVIYPSILLSEMKSWIMFSMVGKFQFERVADLDVFYSKLEIFLRTPVRKSIDLRSFI